MRSAGVFVFALALVAGEARADEADLALDVGGATIETRKVTHGVFTQGSPPTEVGHEKDEEPARQVTISKDFWIGKYPVTRGQFAKFVADTRYVTDAEKVGGAGWDGTKLTQKKDFSWRNPGFTQTDGHPVVLVTYGDANAFVGWASRKSGKRVRLPTEAEWELAARGGTTTPWYGGSTEAEALTLGWFKPNAGTGTRPVGQKKANPLGIYDMSGDVFEWCRDVHAPYHEGAVVDPESTTGAGAEPERRVLRGASWIRDPKRGRSAARWRGAPGSRNADNGFRVVVTSDETVAPGLTGSTTDFAPGSPLGAPGSTATIASTPAAPPGAAVASGPLADGEAVRLPPVGAGPDTFSWGLLIVSPLAAASAAVAWMLLRRKRPRRPAAELEAETVRPSITGRPSAMPRPSSGSLAGVATREVTDGFFVSVPNAPPGSRVRYAGIVNGIEVTDVVTLDGGNETFIYTGSPPTGIRVLQVISGVSGGYRTAERPAPTPTAPPPVAVPPPPPSAPAPPSSAPSSSPRMPPPVPMRPPMLALPLEHEPSEIEASEIVSSESVLPPEPPKSEPKVPEPPKSEPKVPEPPKSEPKVPEPPKSEPKVPEPAKSEPKVPEPPKSEPKAPEPPKSEPKAPEPPKSEPKVPEPPKSEPKVPEPPKSEPKVPEPPKSEPKVPELEGPPEKPPAGDPGSEP